MEIPNAVNELLEPLKHKDEISPEAWAIIAKVYNQEMLSQQELNLYLNPVETAAVLSTKYRRAIDHRYIKELARDIKHKSGHTTKARLKSDRSVGGTNLYKAEEVIGVRLRPSGKSSGRASPKV